jgi:tubulin polyglutamylase TTLL6/13
MLDHKLNPSLIEINYTPSFTTDTPLDRFIKKKLIEDTLRLIGVTEKWKKESKIKRDKEIQERMVTGKRKKYTPEERLIIMREEAKRRNDYERKNMGGFEKIFLLNEEQFLQYKKFYDFSMEVYSNIGKNEFYPSYQRPVSNPVAIYNHYFDEQRFSLPPK